MDMCYLTGQRIGDVLKIERQHLLDDGIYIEQQKTGKRLVVAWTHELRPVVERANGPQGQVAHMQSLLEGRGGKIRRIGRRSGRERVWPDGEFQWVAVTL